MPFANIDGRNMYYEEYGKGIPVVFGYSYLWDKEMWYPQIQELSNYYRCIIPELWGHGRSDILPEGEYNIDSLAQDYVKLLDFLKIDQAVFVGLSVGGMWIGRMAVNFKERVRAMVLIDAVLGSELEEKKQKYFTMLDIIEKSNMIPDSIIEEAASLFFSPVTFKEKPGFIRNFKGKLKAVNPDKIPSIVTFGRAIFFRKSIIEDLSKIDISTLIIVGADDFSCLIHESELLAKSIKDSELTIIENAGHMSNIERPEKVNKILINFLNRIVAEDEEALY